jgi:transformation/transcription domain-associated protein
MKIRSSEDTDDTILSTHLFSVLKGPEPLYHFRRVFAQQWAVNCLMQYVLSINERAPGRVAFVERTGRVLSPEFRTSYSHQGYMDKMLLPFHITPNIVSLIGFPLLEAPFISSIAFAASAVQACREDIDPVWRLLMRDDDLVAFYTKSLAKSDVKTVEMEKQLVERVARNVATVHTRFAECVPRANNPEGEQTTNPIDQRVRDLIEAARNPDNLCMMSGNYQPWL